MINCQYCEVKCESIPMLYNHYKLDHKQTTIKCANCEDCFETLDLLWKHLHQHVDDHALYCCEICLQYFNNKEQLDLHSDDHKSQDKISCPKCYVKVSHQNKLFHHLFSHIQPTYPCPSCNAVFSDLKDRDLHFRNHLIDCPLCEFSCKNDLQLINHTNEFHQSTSFSFEKNTHPCNGKDFIIQEYYDAYQQFEFMCFVCAKRFAGLEALNTHVMSHDIAVCSMCAQVFYSYLHLEKHACPAVHKMRTETHIKTYEKKVSDVKKVELNLNGGDNANKINASSKNRSRMFMNGEIHTQPRKKAKMLEDGADEILRTEATRFSERLRKPTYTHKDEIDLLHSSDVPHLQFSNEIHIDWLSNFVNEIREIQHPISPTLLKKILHVGQSIWSTLLLSPKMNWDRKKFNFLMTAKNDLYNILDVHSKIIDEEGNFL